MKFYPPFNPVYMVPYNASDIGQQVRYLNGIIESRIAVCWEEESGKREKGERKDNEDKIIILLLQPGECWNVLNGFPDPKQPIIFYGPDGDIASVPKNSSAGVFWNLKPDGTIQCRVL